MVSATTRRVSLLVALASCRFAVLSASVSGSLVSPPTCNITRMIVVNTHNHTAIIIRRKFKNKRIEIPKVYNLYIIVR